jgi:hypothetical protein
VKRRWRPTAQLLKAPGVLDEMVTRSKASKLAKTTHSRAAATKPSSVSTDDQISHYGNVEATDNDAPGYENAQHSTLKPRKETFSAQQWVSSPWQYLLAAAGSPLQQAGLVTFPYDFSSVFALTFCNNTQSCTVLCPQP